MQCFWVIEKQVYKFTSPTWSLICIVCNFKCSYTYQCLIFYFYFFGKPSNLISCENELNIISLGEKVFFQFYWLASCLVERVNRNIPFTFPVPLFYRALFCPYLFVSSISSSNFFGFSYYEDLTTPLVIVVPIFGPVLFLSIYLFKTKREIWPQYWRWELTITLYNVIIKFQQFFHLVPLHPRIMLVVLFFVLFF